VFRDADASAAHARTEHFKALIARLPSLFAGPPEIIHVDIPGDGWSRMAELDADPA
jgi:quinol monooxygenase YgiN